MNNQKKHIFLRIFEECKDYKRRKEMLGICLSLLVVLAAGFGMLIISYSANDWNESSRSKTVEENNYKSQDKYPETIVSPRNKHNEFLFKVFEDLQNHNGVRLLVGEDKHHQEDQSMEADSEQPGTSGTTHTHTHTHAHTSDEEEEPEEGHRDPQTKKLYRALLKFDKEKGNIIKNGDFQQWGDQEHQKYGPSEHMTVNFNEAGKKIYAWAYSNTVSVDVHVRARNMKWMEHCTCFLQPFDFISQFIEVKTGVVYKVSLKVMTMEAGYVVIVEFDGHPRFVIRPKVRKGVLEYHFNIKMLGEQEINVPFVENVYGRDAKPKEDLPEKKKNNVEFKIGVAKDPKVEGPFVEEEYRGLGLSDIIVREATEREISFEKIVRDKAIADLEKKNLNNFFKNQEFTKVNSIFLYSHWEGNFGIVKVPLKKKPTLEKPVIILHKEHGYIRQDVTGLELGSQFRIVVAVDSREGRCMGNEIQILLDTHELLTGTITKSKEKFSIEFVATNEVHSIVVIGKTGTDEKQLGTAIIMYSLELVMDADPSKGAGVPKLDYHRVERKRKRDPEQERADELDDHDLLNNLGEHSTHGGRQRSNSFSGQHKHTLDEQGRRGSISGLTDGERNKQQMTPRDQLFSGAAPRSPGYRSESVSEGEGTTRSPAKRRGSLLSFFSSKKAKP